jgi:hypothetical protein
MGDAYREKGPLFERFVKVSLAWAMRGAKLYRGQQSVEGGAGQADVEAPIFHVEAKWRRKADLRAALAQAMDDADPAKLRLVVALDDPDKSGEARAMAVLPFDDLLTLVHALWSRMGAQAGVAWSAQDDRPPAPDVFWAQVTQGRSGESELLGRLRQGLPLGGGVGDGEDDEG